jgi:hypothetical protein
MAAIDFSLIAGAWKDCTGYANAFASEQIESYVNLPFAAFKTQHWTLFTSPQLKEALFHEANHYIDRSLYQLVVGKCLVSDGCLSWGLVAFYYASFFAAQAAIRLKGIFFVKVNYDSETNPPPTHRLEVINLFTHQYCIRRIGRAGGEHQRVWQTFFDEFRNIASRPSWARYEVITAETDPELRLVEMHQRHLINYVPGKGYVELRSPAQAKTMQAGLADNVIADQARSLQDDYLQLETRAFLRLRLCLQLVAEIDSKNGVYHLHHAQIMKRRRSWLTQFECPNHLSRHIGPLLV